MAKTFPPLKPLIMHMLLISAGGLTDPFVEVCNFSMTTCIIYSTPSNCVLDCVYRTTWNNKTYVLSWKLTKQSDTAYQAFASILYCARLVPANVLNRIHELQ